MPILQYHLVEDQYSAAQIERLLLESSTFFAEVLASPIDRVRVFAHLHRPGAVAIGGRLVNDNGARAPYFHFVTLEGRPVEERRKLLAGFTRLVVEVLGVDAALVRGACWPVHPDNWGIGGVPASVLRGQEIERRETAASPKA